MWKGATNKSPTVVIVDQSGQVRTWGPLSRRSAWRAGRFWDDLDGKVKVFLEKDGKRKKVGVEIRIQGARQAFWFVEMNPQLSQHPEGRGDEDQSATDEEVFESDTEDLVAQSATEDAPGMS